MPVCGATDSSDGSAPLGVGSDGDVEVQDSGASVGVADVGGAWVGGTKLSGVLESQCRSSCNL